MAEGAGLSAVSRAWPGVALALGITLLEADARALPAPTVAVSPPAVEYEESAAVYPNPERGWFWPFNPSCCAPDRPHPPLSARRLERLRARPEGITLIRDGVQLGQHLRGPISRETLARIEADWDAARRAGVKVIVRFLYDWSSSNRDPEEAILDRHLDQLAPLLAANEDVIAMVEAGLFGGSGEGNRSDQGYVYYDPGRGGWHRLSPAGIRMYRKLLHAIPASRQMLVRYPRFKWDLLGWTAATARAGADARIGYHDDGWFGDDNHFAFFQLAGERAFAERDTRHVVMGGEPSTATPTNRDPRTSLQRMATLHQTTLNLNSPDAQSVYERWRLSPEWDEMTRRLGHRIALQSAAVSPAPGEARRVRVTLRLVNRGFAPLMNARPSLLVLRNRSTGAIGRVPLSLDLRRVAPNSEAVLAFSEEVAIPREAASYDVGLHFPDAAPRLAHRVEYALRLASEGIWDPATGIHWLGIELGAR
jgi:hypothetical protein